MTNRLKVTLMLAVLALAAAPALAFPRNAAPQAEDPTITRPAAPADNPAVTTTEESPAAAPAAQAPPTKGKVVETMNSGGYTYVCIEKDGQQRWAAMPTTPVTVGEEVELGGGMEMRNFTSKTMGRTFDSILFCSGVIKPAADTANETASPGIEKPTATSPGRMPHPHGMMSGSSSGMPSGHPAMPPIPQSAEEAKDAAKASESHISGKVVETFDGGGYTYVSVEKEGERHWVAIPPTELAVGQEVAFVPGAVMHNFTSGSLNRTFETITFSLGLAK